MSPRSTEIFRGDETLLPVDDLVTGRARPGTEKWEGRPPHLPLLPSQARGEGPGPGGGGGGAGVAVVLLRGQLYGRPHLTEARLGDVPQSLQASAAVGVLVDHLDLRVEVLLGLGEDVQGVTGQPSQHLGRHLLLVGERRGSLCSDPVNGLQVEHWTAVSIGPVHALKMKNNE